MITFKPNRAAGTQRMTALEIRLMLLVIFFRSPRNRMVAANALLYAVGTALVTLVLMPR